MAIAGELDENGYVFDFIAMRDACAQFVAQLDHKVLLPDCHSSIQVEKISNGREVIARFEDRRWIFPVDDCEILPVHNTTAELIARWIGEGLVAKLGLSAQQQITELKVSVEENFGQWATVWIPV